ncbi:MAG: hypothetical protein V3S71_05505 [Acidobacteriota bacterium]
MTKTHKLVVLAALAGAFFILLIAPPVFAQDIALTKMNPGAHVGFEMRWGADRPLQKVVQLRSVLPSHGLPVSAVPSTDIPVDKWSDLNPFNWSRRKQLYVVAGLAAGGATYYFLKAEHRRSHDKGHGANGNKNFFEEYDEDHCYDGNGEDYDTPACD